MGLPIALYFPYIDLDDQALKEFLIVFQGMELLQPVFSTPGATTEEAERKGWVRIHRPLSVDLHSKAVRAMLKEFERLGAMYQDSGYLAYLKHGGGHRLEKEPGYELIREIKEYGKPTTPPDDQERLRGQLLLQMAQDLDRQRREIQEALEELHEQERSLHREMGQVVDDEEAFPWDLEPLPGPEEDDFLIAQRIRAWGEIMGALKEDPLSLLLTDNRLVMEHLLEKDMEHPQPEGHPQPLVLLQVALPRFALPNLTEVARIRDEVGRILPWKVFCEKLGEFLAAVRVVLWSPEGAQEFQARGRALASYFQEAVTEPLMQKVTALEPSWKDGWRQATLEAILFPGITEVGLLKGEASPASSGAARNAVVLHWDRGGADARNL